MKKSLMMCVLICIVFCIAGCNSNTVKKVEPIKYEHNTSFSVGNAETKMQRSEEAVGENELPEIQELVMTTVKIIKTDPKDTVLTQTPSRSTKEKSIEENKIEQSTTQPQTIQKAKPTQAVEQSKVHTIVEVKTVAQKTTEPIKQSFDVSHYVNYAKEYATSIGLSLDSTATVCWDNPISANPNRNDIKSDIQSRLNRYKNSEGFTAVWIWAERVSVAEYEIYIGYC